MIADDFFAIAARRMATSVMREMRSLVVSDLEVENARIAASVVAELGGFATYDQYDAAMLPIRYYLPVSWIAGWGLPKHLRKANNDKMCAFSACKHGLLEPVDGGYRVPLEMAGKT